MTKSNRFLVFAALLLAFTAGACENVQSPTSAEPAEPVGRVLVTSPATQNIYYLPPALSYPADTIVTAVIDRRGGSLAIGDYALLAVGRNAVSEPTTFSMRIVREGFIEVDLRATRVVNGQLVDIGAQGFGASVNLKLNYAYAAGVLDGNRLRVLWQMDGTLTGPMQEVATTADTKGKWITAKLDHFSEYVMASN